jgi:hypothetical protein
MVFIFNLTRLAFTILIAIRSGHTLPIDPTNMQIMGDHIMLPGANSATGTVGPYKIVAAVWKGQIEPNGPVITIKGANMEQITDYLDEIR